MLSDIFCVTGSYFTLSCPSPRPWLLCVWLSPLLARQCAVQVGEKIDRVCQEGRGEISAGESSCQMRLHARPGDHGAWTCMLTYDNDYGTVRTYLDLQVAVMPYTSIVYHSAGEIREVTENSETASAELIAGLEKNFTCSAAGGFPRSQILWEVEKTSSPSLFSQHDHFEISQTMYTMNSSNTLTIHPTMYLHNTTLTCHVTQYSSDGTVLHTVSISILLLVHLLFLPAPADQEPLNMAPPFLLLSILAVIVAIIGRMKSFPINI